MKRKNRIRFLSVLIVLTMLVGLLPTIVFAAEGESDNINGGTEYSTTNCDSAKPGEAVTESEDGTEDDLGKSIPTLTGIELRADAIEMSGFGGPYDMWPYLDGMSYTCKWKSGLSSDKISRLDYGLIYTTPNYNARATSLEDGKTYYMYFVLYNKSFDYPFKLDYEEPINFTSVVGGECTLTIPGYETEFIKAETFDRHTKNDELRIHFKLRKPVTAMGEQGAQPPSQGGETSHNHVYGAWNSDFQYHWKECRCGDKAEVTAHTASDWIVDIPVKATTAGVKHKECTVCHAFLEKVVMVPAPGENLPTLLGFDYIAKGIEKVTYGEHNKFRLEADINAEGGEWESKWKNGEPSGGFSDPRPSYIFEDPDCINLATKIEEGKTYYMYFAYKNAESLDYSINFSNVLGSECNVTVPDFTVNFIKSEIDAVCDDNARLKIYFSLKKNSIDSEDSGIDQQEQKKDKESREATHIHSYVDWKFDSDKQWKECFCGEKILESKHEFKWIVDKEATSSEKGLKHQECTVCGYKKAPVDIPVSDNPKTGKTDTMAIWVLLLFASLFGLATTIVYGKEVK